VSAYVRQCDCSNSYWQIPIRSEDTWLTAFITDFGVFEWLRAPFDLKWSGNSLIRAMQLVLTPLRDISDSYVDDTSVFSDDWTSHMVDLRTFLLAIIDVSLTLNLNKCRFARPQLQMSDVTSSFSECSKVRHSDNSYFRCCQHEIF